MLEELRLLHPVVDKVLRYRTVAKLKSTYCDGLLKGIGPDGRVHSTFNQTETRTGRISRDVYKRQTQESPRPSTASRASSKKSFGPMRQLLHILSLEPRHMQPLLYGCRPVLYENHFDIKPWPGSLRGFRHR